MSDPILNVRDLRLRRGTFELQVPQWNVAPGELVGVVGPNGAGKTTLLETLPGLLRPDSGTVSVFGRDPRTDPGAVRLQLGFAALHTPVFDVRVGNSYTSWPAITPPGTLADAPSSCRSSTSIRRSARRSCRPVRGCGCG